MEDRIPYKVLDESSHEENFVKENVISNDNNEWKSKRGIGLPAWISFDLLVEAKIKSVMLRILDGCNTAPKDMVIYSSSVVNNWKELAKVTRPKNVDWFEASLNTTARFIKIEFLNNQNLTANKLWSTYTYVYEVVFTKI